MILKRGLWLILFCWSGVSLGDHYVVREIVFDENVSYLSGCATSINHTNPYRAGGNVEVGIPGDSKIVPFSWRVNANGISSSTLLTLMTTASEGRVMSMNGNSRLVGYSQSSNTTLITRPNIVDLAMVGPDYPVGAIRRILGIPNILNGGLVDTTTPELDQLQILGIVWPESLGIGTVQNDPLLVHTSIAHAINDNDLIVGQSETETATRPLHVFPYFQGNPPQAIPVAARPVIRAVRWDEVSEDQWTISELDNDTELAPTFESAALSVNNLGDIVGWRQTDIPTAAQPRPVTRAFMWGADGSKTDLQGTAPGVLSHAVDINDNKQVVGSVLINQNFRPFIWEGGQFTELENLGGPQAFARAINNRGEVVGVSDTADGTTVAFFYDGTVMSKLNDLLGDENSSRTTYNIIQANDISDQGVIAGCAVPIDSPSDPPRPVIVTPGTVDLMVEGSGVPDPVTVGNVLTYNIAVLNYGPDIASGVTVHFDFPKNAKFTGLKINPNDLPEDLPTINKVSDNEYTVENMLPFEVLLFLLTFEPESAGNMRFVANVSSGEQEPVDSNNQIVLNNSADACFIASATYGSMLHPYVQSLRHFRDQVLLYLPGGKSFIDWYYRHSPPAAAYIREHAWARWISLVLLTPLIFLLTYPSMLSIPVFVLAWRRRHHRIIPGGVGICPRLPI